MRYIEPDQSLVGSFRQLNGFLRTTTSVVLLFFLWMNVEPAAAAIKDAARNPKRLLGQKAQSGSVQADESNDALREVKATLADIDKRLQSNTVKLTDLTAGIAKLIQLRKVLVEADERTLEGFQVDLDHINKHKLADVIKQRHAAALAEYKARHKAMLAQLDGITSLTDLLSMKNKVKSASAWLEAQNIERAHAPFDPNKLGFSTEKPEVRKPAQTAKELQDLLNPNLNILKKGMAPRPGLEPLSIAARKHESTATLAELAKPTSLDEYLSLSRNIPTEIASSGSMKGMLAVSVITPPGPEFLSPTEDVQITPEIQALALTLHNNPVEIYNWVYNNIEWLPSYGSIQGSQLTLDKKQGNAFDTASLLIALLRASNIPARYVYGTVDIPIDNLQNWIGGTTNPDAAQSLLGQGGIPNVGLTRAGHTVAVRMEHIWAEAFVDYYPSRGAKNIMPDAWVPMDASFKQYTYREGSNLEQQIPFDAESFVAQAQQGAVVNEAIGFVQGLSKANMQSRLTLYHQQLKHQLGNQTATVGDVWGAKIIHPRDSTMLPANIPYKITARGSVFTDLPDTVKHQFQYKIYLNEHQRAIGNSLLTYQAATPSLANKKITLAFTPATNADRETIQSYFPAAHEDGSPIQAVEFPRVLPSYIQVKAELQIDNISVAVSGAFNLGTDLLGEGGFTDMNLRGWDLTTDTLVAGQTSALGLSLHGVSAKSLEGHLTKMSQLKNALESEQELDSDGLEISSDILSAVILSYYSATEHFGRLAPSKLGVINVSGLSYGFFHAQAVGIKRYGVVMNCGFPGMLMDIGHQRRLVTSVDLNEFNSTTYNLSHGMLSSYMEGFIPKLLFSTGAIDDSNISAAGVISASAGSGQPILLVDEENLNTVDFSGHSSFVQNHIRTAVVNGKLVMIPSGPTQIGTWNGTGYIVLDPATGSGAYLIEGGSNGGYLDFLELIVAQPTLLLQKCQGSFLDMFMKNFTTTNASVIGLTVPTGVSLITAGGVALSLESLTIFGALKALMSPALFGRSVPFITSVLRAVFLTAIMNWIVATLFYEFGVAVGAVGRALTCRK